MLWLGLIIVPPVIIHNVWFWICQVFASVFLQLFPMLWIHTPGVVSMCLDRYFSRLFHLHFFSIVANDIESHCSIVEVWAYPWLHLLYYSIWSVSHLSTPYQMLFVDQSIQHVQLFVLECNLLSLVRGRWLYPLLW